MRVLIVYGVNVMHGALLTFRKYRRLFHMGNFMIQSVVRLENPEKVSRSLFSA
jgi:hypothetical protein